MRHDPQHAAAAYLAGDLDPGARARFERHLLDCEDCWRETNTARTGRMLAESLRETAPASLREHIRAVATLPPVSPRARRTSPVRWPYPLVGAAALVLLVLVVVLIPGSPRPQPAAQPAALVEAVALYRAGVPQPLSPDENPPVRQIADYQWQGATRTEVAGIPTIIHTYTAPTRRRLLVLTSPERFPRAVNARDTTPAPSWVAEVDGITMLCADQPGVSWLAIAPDRGDALIAGSTLGLTTA